MSGSTSLWACTHQHWQPFLTNLVGSEKKEGEGDARDQASVGVDGGNALRLPNIGPNLPFHVLKLVQVTNRAQPVLYLPHCRALSSTSPKGPPAATDPISPLF